MVLAAGIAIGAAAWWFYPRRYTAKERAILLKAEEMHGKPADDVDPLVMEDGKEVRKVTALDSNGELRGSFWREVVCQARIQFSGAKWTSANAISLHRWVARYCFDRKVRAYDLETRLELITIAVFKQTDVQKLTREIRAKGLANGDFAPGDY